MRLGVNKLIILFTLALLLFVVSKNGLTTQTESDPELTLLTSQSLLEHGTTNLYNYYVSTTPEMFAHGKWKCMINLEKKAVYYNYPIGTSIICLPVVGVARLMGYDFTRKADDVLWQSIIACSCVSITFLLLFILAATRTSYSIALVLSFLFCIGTSIISSIGRALYSFDFEIIFLLLSFIHISKNYEHPSQINGLKLGVFIFAAWFCRPSAMLVFALIGAWLLLCNRKALLNYIGIIFILFIPVYLYAKTYFNLPVPPYYHPLTWYYKLSAETFPSKLAAILFSPARGLFVFTPALILSFFGLLFKEVRTNKLFVFALAWFLLNIIMLAKQADWWGGWCYGPRLLSEALIPAFLMFAVTFEKINQTFKLKLVFAGFFILSLFGGAVHINGAYNINTHHWNDLPMITPEHINFYKWNTYYFQMFAKPFTNKIKKDEFEIIQQINKRLFTFTDDAHILFKTTSGFPDIITKRINSHSAYSRLNLHCGLQAIIDRRIDTFFITQPLLNDFEYRADFSLQQPKKITLGNYLKQHSDEHIFIATKNYPIKNLTKETKDYFKSIRSNVLMLRERDACVMHLHQGKIITEITSKYGHTKFEKTIANTSVKVCSDGNEVVSIRINDEEFCIAENGFNIVCVDALGKITDQTRFDTQNSDEEFIYFYKVWKNGKY